MTQQKGPDEYTYQRVFEQLPDGAAILEDLIKRFGRAPAKASGIDRILNLTQQEGRREVLDFIVARINQANGVNDYESAENQDA